MSAQNIKQQKHYLDIINQVFEIERKVNKLQENNSIQRNIDKLKEIYEHEIGFIYENPLKQKYDETRTDCEASIAGEGTENLVIVEVIKPIIRVKKNNLTQIVQRAVVVVKSQE